MPSFHEALKLIDMPAHHRERFLGHRQRQQIGEIGAADDAEGDVLRHQPGLDPFGDAPDALEMRHVEAFGAAKREPDAVQRHRVVAANAVEVAGRRAAAHVVLGVDFEPRHLGTGVEHRLVMLETQPDPGFRRNRIRCSNGRE